MARIEMKESIADQVVNQKTANAKHVKDGNKSVLTSFFKEKGIDWAKDLQAGTDALAKQTEMDAALTEAGKEKTIRDDLQGKNWKNYTKGVQFMKKYYGSNFKKLGDWSVMTTADGKIKYPAEVVKRVDLMEKFWNYHLSFAAGSSPLQPFVDENGIDPAVVLTDCAAILVADGKFDAANNAAKVARRDRDNIWRVPFKNLKAIGQFLLSLYVANPFKVGDWGFFVTDTPLPPKLVTKKVKAGGKATNSNVKIDSDFTNTGKTDLNLFNREDKTNTPILVKAGDAVSIPSGFNKIRVENVSKTDEGLYTVYITR